MSDAPGVLGIHRTQNASVCLMQGSPFLITKRSEPELPA